MVLVAGNSESGAREVISRDTAKEPEASRDPQTAGDGVSSKMSTVDKVNRG